MSLPATDNFDRADAANLGSNWTKNTSNEFTILSNQATPSASGSDIMEHWNADTFNNSQYSQVSLIAFTGATDTGPGVAVRCAASAHTGYRVTVSNAVSNNIVVRRFKAGVSASILTITNAVSVNDIIRLEIDSNFTLTVKLNGSTLGTFDDSADGTIVSGSAGLCYSSTSTGRTIDNWEGGNISISVAQQIAAIMETTESGGMVGRVYY